MVETKETFKLRLSKGSTVLLVGHYRERVCRSSVLQHQLFHCEPVSVCKGLAVTSLPELKASRTHSGSCTTGQQGLSNYSGTHSDLPGLTDRNIGLRMQLGQAAATSSGLTTAGTPRDSQLRLCCLCLLQPIAVEALLSGWDFTSDQDLLQGRGSGGLPQCVQWQLF